MMKKLLALSVFLIAFTAAAFSQVSAQATATATIVTSITIATEENLSFGNITPSISGGTVTVPPTGTPSYSGVTDSPSPVETAAINPAIFTVSGTPGAAYNILLPGTITLTGPNGSMTVSNFTSSPDADTGGTLSDDGTEELRVGARLNVGANQEPGTYTSGSFDVTVNYN